MNEYNWFPLIAGIASFISTIFGIIDHISKYSKDFRSQRKPLFFVHGLHLVGFSDEQKQYQLNGRFVSKDNVEYESIVFGWEPDNHYWEKEVKCYDCNNGDRGLEKNDITLNIYKDYHENDTLEWKGSKLHTKRNYSYELEGKYVVKNEGNKKDEKEVIKQESAENKEDKYIIKKDDITKSLTIKANVKFKSDDGNSINTKEISVNPIKCPNIRRGWLISYIIISMLVIFIGVLTTSLLIDNWKSVFMRDDLGLIVLFTIYGILLVLITLYFFVANIKCVSQLLVLIRMKKFGVPRKKKIVSDTLLIPKTWEFMAGTEKVDNIL